MFLTYYLTGKLILMVNPLCLVSYVNPLCLVYVIGVLNILSYWKANLRLSSCLFSFLLLYLSLTLLLYPKWPVIGKHCTNRLLPNSNALQMACDKSKHHNRPRLDLSLNAASFFWLITHSGSSLPLTSLLALYKITDNVYLFALQNLLPVTYRINVPILL